MTDPANKPFFSVIIDNYNYGRYIEQAIDSVFSQTYPRDRMEIIVVDDGSTDNSREIIAKYGHAVIPVYKDNGGQASALNAGFAKAGGDIIAFLDSDDYWHPEKLRILEEAFNKSDAVDFVYHFMDVVDNAHNIIDRFLFPDFGGNYLTSYLCGNLPFFSPTSGMAFRRDCLSRMMPLPQEFRIAADIHMHYVLPFYIRGMSLVKKSLGYYRLHGGNLSGGNLLTEVKLERERGIILMNMTHVECHSTEHGLDSGLLLKRLAAMVKVYDIHILSSQGKRLAALNEALHFRSFLPGDAFWGRVKRIITLLIIAVISPSLNLWLQRKYRKIWHHLFRYS